MKVYNHRSSKIRIDRKITGYGCKHTSRITPYETPSTVVLPTILPAMSPAMSPAILPANPPTIPVPIPVAITTNPFDTPPDFNLNKEQETQRKADETSDCNDMIDYIHQLTPRVGKSETILRLKKRLKRLEKLEEEDFNKGDYWTYPHLNQKIRNSLYRAIKQTKTYIEHQEYVLRITV